MYGAIAIPERGVLVRNKMESSVKIRKCRPSDLRIVGEMWISLLNDGAAYSTYFQPADDAFVRWKTDFEDWLTSTERYLAIAEAGNNPVGYIHACTWVLPPIFAGIDEVFVNEIFVVEDYRQTGVARELLQGVQDWAKGKGARYIRATAIASKPDSIAFWNAIGASPLTTDFVIELQESRKSDVKVRTKLGFQGTPTA